MSSFEKFCGSQFWNETILWTDASWPQFTPCFQRTVITWVPCAWLWLTLPAYLCYLFSWAKLTIPLSWIAISKSCCSLLLITLAVIEIITASSLGHGSGESVPLVMYITPVIKAATFTLSLALIHIERRCGFITSAIQSIFWLVLDLAYIIPFYSRIMYLKEDNSPHHLESTITSLSIFYIEFAIQLMQLLLHLRAEKLPTASQDYSPKEPCPEILASFISQITFWWVNGLVLTGYKKPLESTDLWDLNPRDKSAKVVPDFLKILKKEKSACSPSRHVRPSAYLKKNLQNNFVNGGPTEKTPLLKTQPSRYSIPDDTHCDEKDAKQPSLYKVLWKCYGGTLCLSFACKLVYDLLSFVSPMILSLLIAYTDDQSIPVWKGYVYVIGLFSTALAQSFFYHQNFHISMVLGMRIRSAIIATVYRKALVMSNSSKKDSTVGSIVNLMSVDAQRLQDVCGFLYALWSSPLLVAISLYMLYNTMGPSVFAGVAVMVVMLAINAVVTIFMRRFQSRQMTYKDERLKLTNEVLNGIKVLKLYAWEESFQEKILAIRKPEVQMLRTLANLRAFLRFILTCTPFLVSMFTFMAYIMISADHRLDAGKAFVALSLFNILRFPLNMLPMITSFTVQGVVSVGRLSKYLNNEDLEKDAVQHSPSADFPITIQDGTFTWDRDNTEMPCLRNINVKITDGQLVAVVGQVGSGKSSILSSFLGELEKLHGAVNVRGSVAYVAQEAWIQNTSLRNNILFGKDMDPKTYDNILESCALKPDLQILPGGDLTEIGEKGINLSGGQKQRVSLARAVYNNADIYLLDDPMSAVDAHVGKHIFNKVLGANGLLKGKTRVLVTHGVHWLPMVDQIIVINNGEISEVGSYDELMTHNGAFAQFILTYLTQEEQEGTEEEDDLEARDLKDKMLARLESVLSEDGFTSDDILASTRRGMTRSAEHRLKRKTSRQHISDLSESMSKSHSGEQQKIVKEIVERLTDDERSELGMVKWGVFTTYLGAVGFPVSFAVISFFTLYYAANIASNIWVSKWTEDPVLKNESMVNTSEYEQMNNMYMGVYGGLGAVQAICTLIFALVFAVGIVRGATQLHFNMLYSVLRSPMQFFDTTPIGRIVNRFSRDVETIDNNLPQAVQFFLNTALIVLSTVIGITYSTPIFLAAMVPLAILYYLMQRFYIPTSRQLKRLESTTRSPIYTHFSETITGASTIRAYGVQGRFIKESDDRVDKNLINYFASLVSNRWLGIRLELIGNCIVVAASVFAVSGRGSLSGGLVGLSVSYALQITQALNWVVRTRSDLETNIVSVERVKEYSETPAEGDWYVANNRPATDWPDKGCITFTDYKTRYRPGLELVLKGINCKVKGGEKIGIVGRTGAGKSSMTQALFRIIEAASGSIAIDDKTVADIGLHDLRSKITILPQDPVLFSGSLRMNLDPFGHYSDEQLWQALEHAHLKSFVQSLTNGLSHECGESGHNLSVGQRQLVCLARTLLRKTKILVLDEATAAVDMETDDLIQRTIRQEFRDCTILSIAHRLNTIMDYDRIMVLDQGLLVEFDTPENLLNDQTSIFYGMAKQAGLA